MLIRTTVAKASFCLAAAVTTAALIDPALEALSNRGVFGPGTFTDHSNLDVAPALIVASMFALIVIFGLIRRMLPASGRTASDWLRAYAAAGLPRDVAPLLPSIFALQLGVLWSMETLEQIVVAGQPLGGSIWLGAPVAIGVLAHAVGCVGLTWLLSCTLHWSAKTLSSIITYVYAVFDAFRKATLPTAAYSVDYTAARFREPLLARLSGRAPPSVPA